ncbi:MAG: Thiol:disulfide interchange protein CycY [Gemmatimonadaceae bacterium]|nr:Thiol:disulfide interchange protein CycY [Gemmatimonadaceae bacterium]
MNWKRSAIAGTVALPVIALLAYGLTQDPKEIPSPLPGKEAPSFALEVFSPGQPPLARAIGDTIRLNTMRGQVLVLNFWASWCLACRDEHEALSEVARQYAGTKVHFLGVLYNDVPRNGLAWIEQMGGQSYPSVDDPRARTAIAYGLYGVPETFFVGPDGLVAYKHVGPVTAAVLRRKVDSLLVASGGE